MSEKNIQLANEFAKDYDEQIVKNNWVGPEVLFNMCDEYLRQGQNLLDIGIGTGASALPFFNAGLKISGVDASSEMIKICRSKNIAEQLIELNLETMVLPFENQSFDMVISNALFHLIHPIDLLFKKISGLLKPKGIFAFTFEPPQELSGYKETEPGIWKMVTETGVTTYKHKEEYISTLLHDNKFKLLNKKTFLAFYNKELDKEFYFNAVVAEKIY